MANIEYAKNYLSIDLTCKKIDHIKIDKTYRDYISYNRSQQPRLKSCLKKISPGDTLHVRSIDRLGDKFEDVYTIIKNLLTKNVSVIFYKEDMFLTPSDPNTEKCIKIMKSIVDFMRTVQKEKTERISLKRSAKKNKNYISNETSSKIQNLLNLGFHKKEIAKELNLSKAAVYKQTADPQKAKKALLKKKAKQLWTKLGEIEVDEKECILTPFLDFDIGTHRETIWHWFEDTFDVSVAVDLMGLVPLP